VRGPGPGASETNQLRALETAVGLTEEESEESLLDWRKEHVGKATCFRSHIGKNPTRIGKLRPAWRLWFFDGGILIRDLRAVERVFHLEHGLLGRLEHGVEAPQDSHWQNHVAILSANVEIPEHVIGDAPDEVGDPVESSPFF
jgi:hypothetical protein